jgi:hypothetical protein
MSKSVSVIITGDLGGSENAEMVSSGFDGVTCEIDLGKKNRSGLKRALAPFIEAGRRAPRSRRRRGACRPGGSPADRSAVRAWAGAADRKVSERPDQRRHHAAVRRGHQAGTYVISVRWEGCGLRGRRARGGRWAGAAGFWRKSGTGAPGSSKTRRWTGVWMVSFSGSRPLKLMVWLARVPRWPGRSP